MQNMTVMNKVYINNFNNLYKYRGVLKNLTCKYYRNLIVEANEIQQVLILTKTRFTPVNLNKKFTGT